MQLPTTFSRDTLPIHEALFARVLQSNAQTVGGVVDGLSDRVRARLALFCNARAHLRHLGHAIADTCSIAILLEEGGAAGMSLSDPRSRDLNTALGQHVRPARPITLASAASFAAKHAVTATDT